MNEKNFYDVIIVGGGPAGLSAAIYMARARYKVLVIEKERIGGQITITSEIVNYPGVEKTSGTQLTSAMKVQAEAFGAEFAFAEVLDMALKDDVKVLHTTAGEYRALGVILATGANPRKLGFKGEKEFQGRGVAYCATCDGEFFTGLEVFVIGGGFAAVEEGIFLTKYAKKVTMIVREPDFTCAATVADQVWKEPKISVHFNTEIVEAGGDSLVSHARFRNNQTGEEWTHDAGADGAFGIFVFAGYVPNTGWLRDKVNCNQQGYIITDENQKTNVDGVYAAGDVCIKNLRQVVTAVSDGAVAATSLEKHVSAMHEKLKLPEFARAVADMSRLHEQGGAGASAGAPGTEAAGNAGAQGNADKGTSAGAQGGAAIGAGTGSASGSGSVSGAGTSNTSAHGAASGTGNPSSSASAAGANNAGAASSHGQGFLSDEIRAQLKGLFPRFAGKVIVQAELDDSPLASEISGFAGELEEIGGNTLVIRRVYVGGEEKAKREAAGELFPTIRLYREDGTGGNVLFHGVPGGHEFNSFVIALYNMAGPGQAMDAGLKQKLESIEKPIDVKILVSLSCTMCPDVVMGTQRAAALNEKITAEMVDLQHYPKLRSEYKVMSVPCMIVNGSKVYFGKKNLEEIAGILEEA